jgi:hypothetical protein
MPKLPRYKTLTALRYTKVIYKTLSRVMSKSPSYTVFSHKTLTRVFSRFFAIFLDTTFFSAIRARPPGAGFSGLLRLCETK